MRQSEHHCADLTSELADPNLGRAFVAAEFTLALTGSTTPFKSLNVWPANICSVYWIEYECLKTQSASFAWRFPLGFQAIFLLQPFSFSSRSLSTPNHHGIEENPETRRRSVNSQTGWARCRRQASSFGRWQLYQWRSQSSPAIFLAGRLGRRKLMLAGSSMIFIVLI